MDRVHAVLCRLRSTRRFDMQRAPMFRSSWIRGRSMDTSLEERVRVLEASRYAMIGRINALQTLVINALTDIVIRNAPDPVGTAERMREIWLAAADALPPPMQGSDPVHLDLANQEYREAMDTISADLLTNVWQVAETKKRTGEGQR